MPKPLFFRSGGISGLGVCSWKTLSPSMIPTQLRQFHSLLHFRNSSAISYGTVRPFRLFQTRAKLFRPPNSVFSSVYIFGQANHFHTSAPLLAPKKDPYTILGIDKNASQADVKKAYYKLAKQYHPDSNSSKDAEEKFHEIQGAYEILSDEKKRAEFDRYGHFDESNPFGGQGFGESPFGAGFGFHGAGSPFEELFRAAGINLGRRGPQMGSDVITRLTISFEESVSGVTKDVTYRKLVECVKCDGTGAAPGTKPITCTTCKGTGMEMHRDGFFHVQTTCRKCGGEGKTIKDKCPTCHGEGRVRETSTVNVRIPAGVDDGFTISVPGKGSAGDKGARTGDLLVQLKVAESKIFKRDGTNVHVDVPLTLAQAILGGKILVPTLNGNKEITVNAGTQPGETLRLPNLGIPKVNSSVRGHQFITFHVQIPKNVTKKQRELIEEFQNIQDG